MIGAASGRGGQPGPRTALIATAPISAIVVTIVVAMGLPRRPAALLMKTLVARVLPLVMLAVAAGRPGEGACPGPDAIAGRNNAFRSLRP